jgi:spore maturation protein CgeB
MRLLKIGVYHPTYLQQFYARHSHLATQTYAFQHAALMDDCFGSADFWTQAIRQFGHETCDLIANAEPMQKRWAVENGAAYHESNWMFDITAAQVKAFRPDALIVADYSTVTAAFINRLRDECSSIRLVFVWCGAPYGDAAIFSACDVVLSCVPELVEHFRANGHRCEHLNHAFEPRVLEKIDTAATATADFTFLGSIVKAARFHQEREKILLQLVEQTDLQIWSEIKPISRSHRRRRRARQKAYDIVGIARRVGIPQTLLSTLPVIRRVSRWNARPDLSSYVDERVARRTRPPLFGLAMFQQLHDSKVALNTHIDISTNNASNLRLFEATGVGACMLTDWKSNLRELFEPDAEVVTYRSVEECVEKVRYLLTHENERRSIAAAGQRRTLRDHTYAQRARQIDQIIRVAFQTR